MALTVTPEILGQEATAEVTYCYIGEPLKVHIVDDDPAVLEIYVNLIRTHTETGVVEATREKYVIREVLSLQGVSVDLMEIASQLHNFDVYKIGEAVDITTNWQSVVSEYIYQFEIFTNTSLNKTVIRKLPIIGSRSFETFTPFVDQNTTPLAFLTHDQMEQSSILRPGQIVPFWRLRDITTNITNYTPYCQISTAHENLGSTCNNGGVLYWKSKRGGWEVFGMDLYNDKKAHNYKGRIAVGLFDSTNPTGGGKRYMQSSYTSVDENFSTTVKALSRSVEDLIGLAEISGSPAVYYQKTETSPLEMMRVSSVSAPVSTHIQGGDFSVVLKRISNNSQRVR